MFAPLNSGRVESDTVRLRGKVCTSMNIHQQQTVLAGILADSVFQLAPEVLAKSVIWVMETPDAELSAELHRTGALSESNSGLLRRMVADTVAMHSGDFGAAMEAFGGHERLEKSLGGTFVANRDAVTLTLNASPHRALASEETGSGRYRTLREYARGGMGRILLVHDEQVGREVALKELFEGATPELEQRFHREAQITGQLEHPGIVPVHEIGQRPDGTQYYTMKLVRGRTLAEAIDGAANLQERLSLLPHFIDLCQSISYAHSRGVIHRDLKPQNVIVGEFGETVVLDWGLAKVQAETDTHAEGFAEAVRLLDAGDEAAIAKTAYGQIMGTPMFMPPEQAQGQLDRVDERSDIYSLGAVLYQVLTGRPPFAAGPLKFVLAAAIHDTPTPVRSLVSEVPTELATICEKALQKDAADRYQSAKELADEVQRFQSGALVQAHEYTTGERVARFVNRYRLTVNVALGAMLVLLIGAGVAYVQVANERDNAVEARAKEAASRHDAEYQAYVAKMQTAQAQVEKLDFGPALESLSTAPEEFRHWEWNYLSAVCRPYMGRRQGLGRLFPNSEYGYLRSLDGELTIWHAGDPSFEHRLPSAPYRDWPITHYKESDGLLIALSPDNGRIGYVNQELNAELHDLDAGRLIEIVDLEQSIGTVRFSPEGSMFYAGSNQSFVKLEAATGTEIARYEAPEQVTFTSIPFFPSGSEYASILWTRAGNVSKVDLDGYGREVPMYDFSARFYMERFDSEDYILVWQSNKPFEFWDMRDSIRVTKFQTLLNPRIGEVSKDLTRLFTISDSATMELWDTRSGELLRRFDSPADSLTGLVVSPDGRYVACPDDRRSAYLWDVTRTDPVSVLEEHAGAVLAIEFSPNSHVVATASEDGIVRLWSVPDGALIQELRGHTGPVTLLQFTPDGEHLVTRAKEEEVICWDAPAIDVVEPLPLNCARVDKSGPHLLVSGKDGTASVRNAASGVSYLTVKSGVIPSHPTAVALDRSRGLCAIALNDDAGLIVVWSEIDEALEAVLPGHLQPVNALAFGADAQWLASASEDGTLRVWTLSKIDEPARQIELDGPVTALTVSSSTSNLVASTRSGRVTVWNTATWDEAWSVQASEKEVDHVEVIEHMGYIAAASEDGLITVYTLSGDAVFQLHAHNLSVNDLCFSKDGKRLVSVSDDATLKIWDVARGIPLVAGEFNGSRVHVAEFDEANQVLTVVVEGNPPMAIEAGAENSASNGATTPSDQMRPNDNAKLISVWTRDELHRILKYWNLGAGPIVHQGDTMLTVMEGETLLGRIGLFPGDVILQINGEPIQTTDALKTCLSSYAEEDGSIDSMTMSILRNGRESLVNVILIEPVVEDFVVPIPRGFFETAVSVAVDVAERQWEIGMEELERAARNRGLPVEGLPGIYIPKQTPEITAMLRLVQVVPGDFVLSFAGTTTRTAEDLRDAGFATIEGVKNGEISEIELITARGMFHRQRVHLQFQ